MTPPAFHPLRHLLGLALLLASAWIGTAQAQGVLNVYSARHYPSDEVLYAGFTKQTGIEIRRVDTDDAGLVHDSKPRANNPAPTWC